MNTQQHVNGIDTTATPAPSLLAKAGTVVQTAGSYFKTGALYVGMGLGAALMWGASYAYNTYVNTTDEK